MSESTDDVLKDIRRWVKIIGIQEARSVLDDALSADSEDDGEELRIMYHLSDGGHSTRDIAQHVSVGKDTVSKHQSRWAKMGLLEREHSRAPWEQIVTLEEAGIEVPEISKSAEAD